MPHSTGKVCALPKNVRLARKERAGGEHSSLLCDAVSDEEKKV